MDYCYYHLPQTFMRVGWGKCQRLVNFHQPLFISQSQGGLQKAWVKLICIFVEVFPTLLHEGGENAQGWVITQAT